MADLHLQKFAKPLAISTMADFGADSTCNGPSHHGNLAGSISSRVSVRFSCGIGCADTRRKTRTALSRSAHIEFEVNAGIGEFDSLVGTVDDTCVYERGHVAMHGLHVTTDTPGNLPD